MAFAETTTYSCDYPIYSDEKGSHRVKDKFALTFLVDDSNNKSYMLGNNGSTEIHMSNSLDHIAFLEVTATGNFMTTAIDMNMNTVHSRNSVMLGGIIPSQYYGKCEIK